MGLSFLGVFSALIFLTPSAGSWGCIPWTGGPRIEFDSELECWQWLARAKESNPAIDDIVEFTCTLGPRGPSVARMIWTAIHGH